MSLRWRQARLLAGPVVRTAAWTPVAVAAALSLLALVPALAGAAVPASQVWALRIAAVLLGAAAGFAMADPMAALSTPTPRWLRQWLRAAVAFLAAAAVWLVLLSLAATRGSLPVAALAAEAAVCVLVPLAGGAWGARHGHPLAGPAALAASIAATLPLTGSRSPWPLPGGAAWTEVHRWWCALVPVAVLVLAAANRDLWPVQKRVGGAGSAGSGSGSGSGANPGSRARTSA